MVWRERRVGRGCSPPHLGWPSLSPFGLVVSTGPGFLFHSQVIWEGGGGWLLFTIPSPHFSGRKLLAVAGLPQVAPPGSGRQAVVMSLQSGLTQLSGSLCL